MYPFSIWSFMFSNRLILDTFVFNISITFGNSFTVLEITIYFRNHHFGNFRHFIWARFSFVMVHSSPVYKSVFYMKEHHFYQHYVITKIKGQFIKASKSRVCGYKSMRKIKITLAYIKSFYP